MGFGGVFVLYGEIFVKMIEIKNLKKIFDTNTGKVYALNDINMTINDGDVFGIIGISGAGKSTLLRCLTALEKPTSGDILIDGRSITNLNRAELIPVRKNMGVVFQGYNLLMQKTVFENIAFPLKINKEPDEKIKDTVHELLSLVDLSDKGDNYPSQLSGGQKQRVAIARAMATSPKILLCDEPTSALDPMTAKQVLNLLAEINDKMGVTVVIITHQTAAVSRICNRVAVISDGAIAEVGPVKDVFSNPKKEITKLLLEWDN
jgi:D-methionine transport system ATP-binding protein